MQPPVHLMFSWFVGEAAGLHSARNRRIVALAGVAPDLDVLLVVPALFFFDFNLSAAYSHVWNEWHRYYTHGLVCALMAGIIAGSLVARTSLTQGVPTDTPLKVASLAATTYGFHILCDLIGTGAGWAVYPFWPFSSDAWEVSWAWDFLSWQNNVILLTGLVAVMIIARYRGRSPLESFNYRLDRWFVGIVRNGSDRPSSSRSAFAVRFWTYLVTALFALIVLVPIVFDR